MSRPCDAWYAGVPHRRHGGCPGVYGNRWLRMLQSLYWSWRR